MNNYFQLSTLPIYFIAAYLIYKRRKIYRKESLKKIVIVRAVLESNRGKIHIDDAKRLFNSLNFLETVVKANKTLNKAEKKEWEETFTISVKSLNVDAYDKKTLLSAVMVLEYTNNSYKFTIYSILLLIIAFIAQLTFFILSILNVI